MLQSFAQAIRASWQDHASALHQPTAVAHGRPPTATRAPCTSASRRERLTETSRLGCALEGKHSSVFRGDWSPDSPSSSIIDVGQPKHTMNLTRHNALSGWVSPGQQRVQARAERSVSWSQADIRLSTAQRQVLADLPPPLPTRPRDLNECALGVALTLITALWSQTSLATSTAEINGVSVQHTVRATVVTAASFKSRIMTIVRTGTAAFSVVRTTDSRLRSDLEWVHLKAYTYLRDAVRGTGAGIEFSSYFSKDSTESPFHLFVVDFPVDNLVMRSCLPLENSERVWESEGRERLDEIEHLFPGHHDFAAAARRLPFLNSQGLHLKELTAMPPPTGSVKKFTKQWLLYLIKSATAPLLTAPLTVQMRHDEFDRDGFKVHIVIKIVCHLTADDARKTRSAWFPNQPPPVHYPTSDSPAQERGFDPANYILANILPKDVSTLLRFILLTCPRLKYVTLAVTQHYAYMVNLVAFLQVGFKDQGVPVDHRPMHHAVKALCDLGIPEKRWGVVWNASKTYEPGARGPLTPAELVNFGWNR